MEELCLVPASQEEVKLKQPEYCPYLDSAIFPYHYINKFKSVRRAIKRGHIIAMQLAPKRPFNNRGNTTKRTNKHSRSINEQKKRIYGSITSKR